MLRGPALLFAAVLLFPVDVDGQVLSRTEVRDVMVGTYDTLRIYFPAEGMTYLDPEPHPWVPSERVEAGMWIREDSSATGPSIKPTDLAAVSDRLSLPVASPQDLKVCREPDVVLCRFRSGVAGVLEFGEIAASDEGVSLIARVSWSAKGPSGYDRQPIHSRTVRVSLRPMPDGEWRVERMATLVWAG